MMQHQLWHRRQHKQRWACIGIDKVGPKRGVKELMAGVRAHQQESLNAEWGTADKKGFVSAPCRNVTYRESQCLKKGRRSDLFFMPSILMHTSDFMLHF